MLLAVERLCYKVRMRCRDVGRLLVELVGELLDAGHLLGRGRVGDRLQCVTASATPDTRLLCSTGWPLAAQARGEASQRDSETHLGAPRADKIARAVLLAPETEVVRRGTEELLVHVLDGAVLRADRVADGRSVLVDCERRGHQRALRA